MNFIVDLVKYKNQGIRQDHQKCFQENITSSWTSKGSAFYYNGFKGG